MLKDLLNVVSGEMLESMKYNIEMFEQQCMFIIVMATSNSFFS